MDGPQDILVENLCSSYIMLFLDSCTHIKTNDLKSRTSHAITSAARTLPSRSRMICARKRATVSLQLALFSIYTFTSDFIACISAIKIDG
jgi:hypothetical protein